MTTFTKVYDALVSLIGTELAGYNRLANAYDVVQNDYLSVVKGYSLSIGQATNTERHICGGELTTAYEFTLTTTKLSTANDEDATGRASLEKSLVEDVRKVYKKLQSTTVLGTIQVSNVKFLSDDGIQYLYDLDNKVMGITSVITLEFFD
jgi:hypothetical protein